MIMSALIAKLRSAVGHSRVYPIRARKNAIAPFMVVETNSSFPIRHWGTGQITTGITYYDFEIYSYGKTQTDVYNLGLLARNALENFSGPVNSTESPVVTYNIKDVEITSDLDGYDPETELFYYSIFVTIAH